MSWCRHCMEEIEGKSYLAKNLAGRRVPVCSSCHAHFQEKQKWPPIYLRENHMPIKRDEPITLDFFDRTMTEFEHYRWAGWYKGALIRG